VVFDWDNDKNEQLKRERGISFEQIVFLVLNDRILDILEHPNKIKYSDQKLYVIDLDDYAYVVPFEDRKGVRFLKTIFPSRIYPEISAKGGRAKMKLTKEETELMESLEKDEWKTISSLKEEIKRSKAYARSTITKDQRMNIRIAKKDLDALKVKAIEEGIPYQTLVSSIIHKFLSGRLIERHS